jgi:hypothetical protein
MDETGSRWFRWISDHAQYLFWGIWGAGSGAFGAVLFNAVPLGGDGLRVYLAILTAMMGGALGLATSRAMDMLSDRRKARRKIFIVLYMERDLRLELAHFEEKVSEVQAVAGRTIDSKGTTFTPKEVAELVARAERVQKRAVDVPEFEEIIVSMEDADVAMRCRSTFLYCADVYACLGKEEAERRAMAARCVKVHKPLPFIVRLQGIEDYFAKRLEM